MKETYLVNGRKFASYDEVIAYCQQNNFRVTNTQTIGKNTYVISITNVTPIIVHNA